MVRLKGADNIVLSDEYKSFNSIVVRLKGGWCDGFVCGYAVFQFHSGSIKSLRGLSVAVSVKVMFQFHSGSIKSDNVVVSHVPFFYSFNSIVVRLKGRRFIHKRPRQNFVSIP